ncbi:MAG: S46 family peptidase [Bacteroidetes bacterium]|nr:S46 family peptidase [Bacteroidota bacterium]
MKQKYGNAIPSINAAYNDQRAINLNSTYLREAVLQGSEITTYSYSFSSLEKVLDNKESKPEDIKKVVDGLKEGAKDYFKDYNAALDQKL